MIDCINTPAAKDFGNIVSTTSCHKYTNPFISQAGVILQSTCIANMVSSLLSTNCVDEKNIAWLVLSLNGVTSNSFVLAMFLSFHVLICIISHLHFCFIINWEKDRDIIVKNKAQIQLLYQLNWDYVNTNDMNYGYFESYIFSTSLKTNTLYNCLQLY